jgi:bacterioferritin-associated ferredoxin
MIICVCNNVQEKQIVDLVKKGLSKEDILKLLKIGKDCSTCLEYAVIKIIETAQNKK